MCLSGLPAHANQCAKDKQKAIKECDPEKVKETMGELAAFQQQTAGAGTAKMADELYKGGSAKLAKDQAFAKMCGDAIQGCIKSCTSEAQKNRAQLQEGAAAQNDQDKKYCQTDKPAKAKEAAEKSNMDMGKILEGLMALLQALGKGDEKPPEEVAKPFCTENPTDPACKDDSPITTGSGLTAGEFRRGDTGAFAEGDVGTEATPLHGTPAQPSNSSSGGGMGMPMAGGGGGGLAPASARDRESSKKSEFDGAPKINIAGGAMGAGGGGGARGGGGSSLGKASGNPIASRTGLNDENQANKAAAAAEDRLRGPASNNEPLGGVSSVYYLDNFTKVEKRMITERNTLKEH